MTLRIQIQNENNDEESNEDKQYESSSPFNFKAEDAKNEEFATDV